MEEGKQDTGGLKCNGCWTPLGGKDQAAATACHHLYCIGCIQEIVQSSDSSCPICRQMISKTNAKAVRTLSEDKDFQLTLAGQTPDVIMSAAMAGLKFYMVQQGLYKELQRISLSRKLEKHKLTFKDKFEQLQTAFKTAKRKLSESQAESKALAADNEELMSKYSQKATQAKRLQESAAALSQENMSLKSRLGGAAPGNGMAGILGLHHAGGGGAPGSGMQPARQTPFNATPRQLMGMPQLAGQNSGGRAFGSTDITPALRRPAGPEISAVHSPNISAFSMGQGDGGAFGQARGARPAAGKRAMGWDVTSL